MSHELQRIVALARIVLQVDSIPGRKDTAQHVVSVEDMHVTIAVPTQPGDPWRVEITEVDSEILSGEGTTAEAAVADLRAKVEYIAACLGEAIRDAQRAIVEAGVA